MWDDGDDNPSFDLEWTIAKANPVYVLPSSLTATYGDLLSTVALPHGWTWDETDPAATVGAIGSQTHAATFTPEDTDNYNIVTGIDVTISVKMTYDMSGVTFADRELTYTGETHSIEISGDLPEGVTVTYENNAQTTVGVYTVTAVFATTNADYHAPAEMTATLTIVKADYDMSGITFSDSEVTYNGAAHIIEISGDLPDGVTVTYENNAQTAVGVYTVTAVFATTNANYHTPANMTATLTIKSIPTSSGEMLTANPLRAWTRNGMLHITGLSVGETLSIYTSTGALVHQSKPDSEEMDIPFSVQGVYVVHSGRNTIRVVVQ